MLEALFGSKTREDVLLYIQARESGSATEITQFFKTNISQIQKQLEKLEVGGVLFSKTYGRTKIYQFSPRYAFLTELKAILEKVLSFHKDSFVESLKEVRKRPRRTGKPL